MQRERRMTFNQERREERVRKYQSDVDNDDYKKNSDRHNDNVDATDKQNYH